MPWRRSKGPLRPLYIGSRINEAGWIVHLKGLTGLTFLALHETQVTDAAIKELQQALPDLKIYH